MNRLLGTLILVITILAASVATATETKGYTVPTTECQFMHLPDGKVLVSHHWFGWTPLQGDRIPTTERIGFRITDVSAMPDFGQTLKPVEAFPVTITNAEAAAYAKQIKWDTGSSNKARGVVPEVPSQEAPIGDQVTLTVLYGNDQQSQALKRAFATNPLAPVRKQMRYDAVESSSSPAWSKWLGSRELPAVIVMHEGKQVLVRTGRQTADVNKLADDIGNSYDECFHGGKGRKPPPDTDDDDPPAPPPGPAPPPVSDGSSASIGTTGVIVGLSSFLVGGLAAGAVGLGRRLRGNF